MVSPFESRHLKYWRNFLSRRIYWPSWRRSVPKSETNKAFSLPPSPRELLQGRTTYELPLLNRWVNEDTNAPLTALYRIYEHIMLDQHIEIRNELEAFWFKSDWKVCDIPDPKDPDPERYAVLSCIPCCCASHSTSE